MSGQYSKRGNYSSLWKNSKGPVVSSMTIELTERCNNNCIHCYINLPADNRKVKLDELSTECWKDIIKQIADLGAMEIRFTGGEPLIREDFKELYTHARQLGMKVLIFTNGTLITDEVAQLLKKIPPLKNIEVTVYGMKQSSYEAVTKSKGSFKKFQAGIDNLSKYNIPFILKSAVLPPNRSEIEEFETWAKSITSQKSNPSYSFFFDLRGRRDSKQKNEQIKKLRLSPEEGLKILTKNGNSYKEEMRPFIKNFLKPPGTDLFNCGAGLGGSIDAYGIYQPCLLLRHPEVTWNLKDYTLKEIFDQKIPQLKKMKATNSNYISRCANCFLKRLCDQCPAKSWSEYGTLDTPVEHLCAETHAQALYLGLIDQNEKGWEITDWEKRIKNL